MKDQILDKFSFLMEVGTENKRLRFLKPNVSNTTLEVCVECGIVLNIKWKEIGKGLFDREVVKRERQDFVIIPHYHKNLKWDGVFYTPLYNSKHEKIGQERFFAIHGALCINHDSKNIWTDIQKADQFWTVGLNMNISYPRDTEYYDMKARFMLNTYSHFLKKYFDPNLVLQFKPVITLEGV